MPAFFWQDVFFPNVDHVDLTFAQIALSEAAGMLIIIAITIVLAIAYAIGRFV